MPSFFAAVVTASDAMQDRLYGEAFLVEPQARPSGDRNARPATDTARASSTITGVWTDPHATIFPHNRTRHPDADSARVGDDKPTLDFITAALPFTLVIGDWITRVGTSQRYAVSDVSDDGFTRTTVALTAAKGV